MAHMKQRLRIAPLEAKPLVWWWTRRERIDMSPPYQRKGRLWSNADKAFLIDSILNGFDVPKIYVADFTWLDTELNEKRLPYAIIDGKQRFEAVFDFFEGKLRLHDGFKYRERESLPLAGLSYPELQARYPDVADVFSTFNLSVMAVQTDSVDLVNELFVRLNRSKPLTGAEVRNALAGPAAHLIRSVAEHEFFKAYARFANQRGQDLNAATKLVKFEFEGRVSETKKRNLDHFAEVLAEQTVGDNVSPKVELAFWHVLETLGAMTGIFLPSDVLLRSAGIIPVYYWVIRAIPPAEHPLVRECLAEFERVRSTSLDAENLPVGTKGEIRELRRFTSLSRSTNDQASYEGRCEILLRYFQEFKLRRARTK